MLACRVSRDSSVTPGICLFPKTSPNISEAQWRSEVKRTGYKAYYSFPSSADIKNEWNCTSTPAFAFMWWTGTIPPFHIPYSGQGTADNWTLLSTASSQLENRSWKVDMHTHSQEVPDFYATSRFIPVFTKACHSHTVFTKYYPRTKAYPALRL